MKPALKVLQIMINTDWMPDPQPVIDAFASKVDLVFKQKKLKVTSPSWTAGQLSTEWVKRYIYNEDCDIVVMVFKPEEWNEGNEKGNWGYSPYWDGRALGFQFIGMRAVKGGKREESKGWQNNDEFLGRLRHELTHTCYQLCKQPPAADKTHDFDYYGEWKDVLENINWKELEPKPPVPKMIAPMDYDHFGYEFGQKVQGASTYHPGVDLNFGPRGDSDLGLPISAPADGTVIFAAYTGKGWGNLVVIHHEELGLYSRIAHWQQFFVAAGQKVTMGQHIGKCGKSGTSSPHCHWELLKKPLKSWTYYPNNKTLDEVKGTWISPLEFLENNS